MSSPPDLRSALLRGGSADELQEMLYGLRATDGLPVILPTPDRVARTLHQEGYDRPEITAALMRKAGNPVGLVRRMRGQA